MKTRSLLIFFICCMGLAFAESRTIVRYQTPQNTIHFGLLERRTINQLDGDLFSLLAGEFNPDGITWALDEVELLVPLQPGKMINFGYTYSDPGQDGGEDPLVFLKSPSALIAHSDSIVYPDKFSNDVKFEAELALVIKKQGKNIPVDEALEYVFAYTCHNDITAADVASADKSRLRGKNFDTFAPLGPWLVTGIENPQNLNIQLRVNGELKQDSNTADMTYTIAYLIHWISNVMTLEPGDVIATGTPPSPGPLQPGDTVSVTIEKIGTLTNVVK